MLDYNSFQRLSGADEFFSTVENRLRLAASEPASFRTSLPLALQASADYQVRPGLYVNTLWVQNLASARPLGIKKENLLALTPRYEHRWYEISMPLSLMNQYRSFGIGLAGRIGPLWMGTDHLTGLFNLGKPKAVTFYAGLSMGIFRRGPDEQLPCWPPQQNWFRRLFQKEK